MGFSLIKKNEPRKKKVVINHEPTREGFSEDSMNDMMSDITTSRGASPFRGQSPIKSRNTSPAKLSRNVSPKPPAKFPLLNPTKM